MIEPTLSEATLKEWIAKQEPWRLDVAIWLLLRVEPGSLNFQIRDGNSKLPPPAVRVFTKARRALVDPSNPLNDLSGGTEPKASAADYRVYKRDFIAWAKDNWGDASHLIEALQAYDSVELKPWQTEQDSQYDLTRNTFEKVMEQLDWPSHDEFSHSKLFARMKQEAGRNSGMYGKTRTIELLKQWRG